MRALADEYGFILACPDGRKTSWWYDSPVDSSLRHKDTFGAVGNVHGGVDVTKWPNNWDLRLRLGERDANLEIWTALAPFLSCRNTAGLKSRGRNDENWVREELTRMVGTEWYG